MTSEGKDARGACSVCQATRKVHEDARTAGKKKLQDMSAVERSANVKKLRRAADGNTCGLYGTHGTANAKMRHVCLHCNVFLCPPTDLSGLSCSEMWHSESDLSTLRV